MYFPIKTIIKHVVQESVQEKNIDRDELSVLAFNVNDLAQNKYALIWVKPEKEFRFNGEMYDVEYTEVNGDSIYFTCYFDVEENFLEKIFALQNNDYKKDKTQNSANRIILLGLFSEETKKIYSNIQNRIATDMPLQKNEAGLLSNINDVLTPPPRKLV